MKIRVISDKKGHETFAGIVSVTIRGNCAGDICIDESSAPEPSRKMPTFDLRIERNVAKRKDNQPAFLIVTGPEFADI